MEGEEQWWKGPKWLGDRERWPCDIVTSSTPESQAKAKVTLKMFSGARDVKDEFDMLLENFTLWKVLRVCGWISRCLYNSRKYKEERTIGPLTTEEIERRKLFWVARATSVRSLRKTVYS